MPPFIYNYNHPYYYNHPHRSPLTRWLLVSALAVSFLLLVVVPAAARPRSLQAPETSTPSPVGTVAPGSLLTITETLTPTLTPEPTATAIPTSPPPVLFPLVFQQFNQEPVQYLPTTAVLYCNNSPVSIPDNNAAVASSSLSIGDNRFIGDLDISLDITHTWVGDLVVNLTHQESGQTINLVDRPGYPATSQGCGGDGIRAVLDDEMNSPVENKCGGSPAAVAGSFLPTQPLATFDLGRAAGTWVLTLTDNDKSDFGRLNGWCLLARVGEAPAPETSPPPSPALPAQARVNGIHGQHQALPLDCESRSAVDWAGFFGFQIDELRFFRQLPKSDNPDTGFVGDVNGTWGQIPPNDYGIHAEPVAGLLRAYGVSAYAHRPLRWEQLKAEIAAGRPVYTWVIGSVYAGAPVFYTPSDGLHTLVAPREHTVIVVGYTPSEVTIMDGDSFYNRSITTFLDSWSALGNMAITVNP